MPNADASLPSARDRRLSFATPAIESTMASRKFRSFSFWRRTKVSSFRGLWFLGAGNSCAACFDPKSFFAPLALSDLLAGAAAFFVAFAAGFFAAVFLAGFDDLAAAFFAFGRGAFFAEALDFAGVLEFFFFTELAIIGRRPWLAGRERRLTKGHFQPGARGDFPAENEQKKRCFAGLYELALE